MDWTSTTWFYAGVFLKLASFVGLPTLEMEIGLGRPAMTDMLSEDEAVLFGLLGDGLPDLNDWNLEWPPPDSTAALATEPASSPQLASRHRGQPPPSLGKLDRQGMAVLATTRACSIAIIG